VDSDPQLQLFNFFFPEESDSQKFAKMADTESQSLAALLSSLKSSLDSANGSLPQESTLLPPDHGISLFDTKNELFLSYVQNLVFLILIKMRHASSSGRQKKFELQQVNTEVVKKLAELRLYLEKGVRPLENRLKYQVDKVVRAADDLVRPEQRVKRRVNGINGHAKKTPIDASDSDSAVSSAASAPSDSDSDDNVLLRPNAAALARHSAVTQEKEQDDDRPGIYKPPRITPTALPTTSRPERVERKAGRSAALDEFIADELSAAPIAEPSIGSNIRSGGRSTMSKRERDEYAERKVYEESNFLRLPAGSKKDKTKRKTHDGAFGGEEWRNLGIGLDRIERLTKKKGGAGGQLANSRKRPVQDGPRDSGFASSKKPRR
jgi:U3 small nucleolar ribonucleoprotein protein LCP5